MMFFLTESWQATASSGLEWMLLQWGLTSVSLAERIARRLTIVLARYLQWYIANVSLSDRQQIVRAYEGCLANKKAYPHLAHKTA